MVCLQATDGDDRDGVGILPTVWVTVQRAQSAAVALRSSSRCRLSVKWLIVVIAIFLAL